MQDRTPRTSKQDHAKSKQDQDKTKQDHRETKRIGLAGLAERLQFLDFLSLRDFLSEGNDDEFLIDRPLRGPEAARVRARVQSRCVRPFWLSCWMVAPPPLNTNEQCLRLRIIHPVVGVRDSRGKREMDAAFRHAPERVKRMASGAKAGRALWS